MAHTSIHPTAVVAPDAELGSRVEIGPFVIIERGVVIGDGCRLAGHAVVKERVVLGRDNTVHEGAVLGGRPQHLRAGDRLGGLRIGNGNTIRENVTIHAALAPGDVTLVGNGNLLMVNAHVAHDCRVGDHTILTNNVMLAGHITVEDRAYISGGVGIHQFLRVGRFSMVGGLGHVKADVPPYVTVDGDTNKVVGLNVVGLRRGGFTCEEIQQLKEAYRVIYRNGLTWREVLRELKIRFPHGPAAHFHAFLSTGKRGFVQERRTPRDAVIPFSACEDAPRPPPLRRVA